MLFAKDEFEDQLTDNLNLLIKMSQPKGKIGKSFPPFSSKAKIEIAKSDGESNLIKRWSR